MLDRGTFARICASNKGDPDFVFLRSAFVLFRGLVFIRSGKPLTTKAHKLETNHTKEILRLSEHLDR